MTVKQREILDKGRKGTVQTMAVLSAKINDLSVLNYGWLEVGFIIRNNCRLIILHYRWLGLFGPYKQQMDRTAGSSLRRQHGTKGHQGQKEHLHLLGSMQLAVRKQEGMLKDMHRLGGSKEMQKGQREVTYSEEMLGDVHVPHMDFYHGYNEQLSMGQLQLEQPLDFFVGSEF